MCIRAEDSLFFLMRCHSFSFSRLHLFPAEPSPPLFFPPYLFFFFLKRSTFCFPLLCSFIVVPSYLPPPSHVSGTATYV